MEGSTCATLPSDVDFGSWEHISRTHDCLRQLAYTDWMAARAEVAHIASWEFASPDLDELTFALTYYDSASEVGDALRAHGLLTGKGEPGVVEYFDEDWQPLTGSDWLLTAGNLFSFDAETGMHPNEHDALLYDIARLFGDALADARFTETAPHWESDEPYQLHASFGDREWKRQAANYGDWYDVSAVLDLVNEMAADIGIEQRVMPLPTYDQTVTVIVGPGEGLVAAASVRLIRTAEAEDAMELGKVFEEEIRRRFRLDVE